MIETTAHFTSYNDFQSLKICLESFLKTITYDKTKLEIIIVDNGSTESKTIEFIKSFKPEVSSYKFIFNDFNDYPTCLEQGKVQARRIASGDYFIDIPDDHLFFLESNWIEESIEKLKEDETAGCICYAAQPEYRYHKQNNKFVINKNYLKSLYKGYADYHIMSKKVYNFAGEFKPELGRSSEGEYMGRMLQLGYFRNIMKIPAAIINDNKFSLIEPVKEDLLIERFKNNQFISNEELINFLITNKNIKS